MNIDAAKLKSYVERINRLLDERDALLSDIRDIYAEAKGNNVVPKVLRKVIARKRAKDPAALILEDDLLDSYLAALDGPTRKAVAMAAQGATAREIEQATGIDHVTVSRSVSLKKNTETQVVSAPAGGDTRTPEPSRSAEVPATPLSSGGMGEAPVAHAEGVSTTPKPTPAAPLDTRSFDEIAGEIPAHLRRVRAA